jgi:hypothetical protein
VELRLESAAVHCTFTWSPFASVPRVTEMLTEEPTMALVGELLMDGVPGAVLVNEIVIGPTQACPPAEAS